MLGQEMEVDSGGFFIAGGVDDVMVGVEELLAMGEGEWDGAELWKDSAAVLDVEPGWRREGRLFGETYARELVERVAVNMARVNAGADLVFVYPGAEFGGRELVVASVGDSGRRRYLSREIGFEMWFERDGSGGAVLVLMRFYYPAVAGAVKEAYAPFATMANVCLLADLAGVAVVVPCDVTGARRYYHEFGFVDAEDEGERVPSRAEEGCPGKWRRREPCGHPWMWVLRSCVPATGAVLDEAACEARIREVFEGTWARPLHEFLEGLPGSCYFLSSDAIYPWQRRLDRGERVMEY